MSRQSRSRASRVIRAAAPVGAAVAASLLAGVADVRATTWIGTTGNWNDPANWSGTPNPPSDDISATGGPTAFIGNNGTVTFDGPDAAISRFNLGFSYVGIPLSSAGSSSNPGTGVLNLTAGILRTNQDLVIGDGAAGTLNIDGGTLYVASSKHVYLGPSATGTINLTSGNLFLGTKYGIEDTGAFSSFNMSGGNLEFRQFSGAAVDDNQNQILADDFTFSGGALGGAATTGASFTRATIHHVSGSGSIAVRKNSNSTLTFDLADPISTWSGTSAPAGNGTAANNYGILVKTGTGQLTINNTQAGFTRDVQVHGGTLVLDYASLPGGIIHDGAGIGMRGGTLILKGDGGSTTDLIGLQQPFRSGEGGSTVILDPNGGTITLNTTGSGSRNGTRAVGSTIDFQVVTGATLGTDARVQITTTTNRVNNVLRGWTVNGGTEWGTRSGTGFIVPLTNYEADTDLGTAVSGAAKNMKPSGPQSDVTASAQFNLINLTGTTGINMTGAGTTISLSMGGIIGNTTGSITGGALTVASAAPTVLTPTDLIVVNPLDLLISSDIVDNGDANSPVALTKSGAGTLTVSGTNTYSNNTYVNGGVLKLGSAAALPSTTTIVMSNTPGATLDLNGNSVSVVGLAGGGSSGGEVKLSGDATLDITGSAPATFAGIISGTGGITKSTSGEFALTGKSTYTGVTNISRATLIVTSLADGGEASSIGAGGSNAENLVLDNATLQSNMKTTMTTNRLFSVGTAGATLSGNPGTGSLTGYFAPLRFTNTGTLGMAGGAFPRTLTLDAGSTAQSGNELALNLSENKLSAVIPDSGPGSPTFVTKQGVGLWYLDALNTYTGATTVNGGILRINSVANSGQPSAIGAATDNLVLNGGTLQYIGAGHSTDRLVTLGGSVANTIDASGGGAVNFTNTGATSIGAGGLVLTGTNTGGNTLSAALDGAAGITKGGAGTWVINGNNTYTGTTRVNAGLLVVAQDLTTSSAIVVAGGTLQVAPAATRVLSAPTVTITGQGRIDLKDNKLLTTAAVGDWDGTKYTGIQGEVARAYDFGAWDLPGIMTSEADAGPTVGKATIGVATGQQALFLGADETGVFAGQTITGATTIAMYTWAGDVDLNGYVDAVDYGTIDQWIQFPGTTGYTNGDLNYDGVIDAVDYGIIDNGIQLQGAPIPISGAAVASSGGLSGVTAVPEPASMLVLGAAGALMTLRRRRRRHD